jgi:hypothetical protein
MNISSHGSISRVKSRPQALPPATSGDLLALMQQADEIVAGCRVAQEFIKSQGMGP